MKFVVQTGLRSGSEDLFHFDHNQTIDVFVISISLGYLTARFHGPFAA